MPWSVTATPRGDRDSIATFAHVRRILAERFGASFREDLPVGWAISRYDDSEFRIGCLSEEYRSRQDKKLRPGRGYTIEHIRALVGGILDTDTIQCVHFEVTRGRELELERICGFCRELGLKLTDPKTAEEIDLFEPGSAQLLERLRPIESSEDE